jgi:hypothetical protein
MLNYLDDNFHFPVSKSGKGIRRCNRIIFTFRSPKVASLGVIGRQLVQLLYFIMHEGEFLSTFLESSKFDTQRLSIVRSAKRYRHCIVG